MKEVHRARYVGRGCRASEPPAGTTLPKFHVFTNLEAPQTLSF